MSDLKKFSDALKTWRIQKNLTQNEVAKRMGISRSVLSFLENGQQAPKMRHLSAQKSLSDYLRGFFYRAYDRKCDN